MDVAKFINKKNLIYAISAYLISYILLMSIFIYIMQLHYDGYIDWEYLRFAAIRIGIISLIPALAVKQFKIKNTIIAVLLGAVVALVSVVAYVNFALIT